jgi:hypothetical protein
MKKLLGGCLALVLIAVVALGLALFYGYQAARPMIDNARGMLEQGREIAALSDRVTNKSDYVPPATGELSDAQVQRFLAVHGQVRQTLGPRWSDLQTRATAVENKAREGGRDLSFSEVGSMLSDFGGLLRDARRAHVDALNAEQFSASEYNWVKLRAYEAAGLEAMQGIDWASIQETVKEGAARVGVREPQLPEVPRPEIPARNRELVKPHYDDLKAWLPLTVLGF